ncbi:MAG: twin-arginine translocase TatA/TatE family subunit [Bacteroidota bacterium]
MFGMGTSELMLIGLVILVLFGAKKIPEFMKGIGKGVSEFKKGMNEVQNELNKEPTETKPEEKEKK